MSARELIAKLRDWFRRDQLDAELAEELRFHRAHIERDAGADAAARRLGNQTRWKEEARDFWSIRWLDQAQQDLRYALRGLRRSPGFTATVILTLGLGIGANAAMFGVIDRLMFRPFAHMTDPARVHRVYLQQNDRQGKSVTYGSTEYTRFLDLKRWTTAFDLVAGFAEQTMAVGTGDASREHRVGQVSASYFDFFHARPVIGRFFGASEDTTPRGAPVAVLGHAYWLSEYGGRDVLGQVIHLGNIPATIIGVAPKDFVGVATRGVPAAYIPITTYAAASGFQRDPTTYYTTYNWGWMNVMVRRKPGITAEQANADLTSAFERSWAAELALDPEVTPAAVAKPRAIAGPLRTAAGPDAGLESKTLLWVSGVAVIVLLIACANVANLMFSRVLRRRRETAVRLALGVSRGRLVMQSLIESLLLAALGCGAGLLIAQWGGAALRRVLIRDGSLQVLTDWRTLGVAALAALVAGVLTGVGPAYLATRENLAAALKAGPREGGQRGSRTRSALLVVQAALSVVLLVGAALFVRSLGNVRAMRLGFDIDPVLMVTTNLRGTTLDSIQRDALRQRMLEAATGMPGVAHAAMASSVPFWSTSTTNLYVTGIDSVDRLGRFTYQAATPDYFNTTGTRILRGRPFNDGDRTGAPNVVVVSESMARVLWPAREALGECVRIGSDTVPCTTVIGIAEDAVQNSLTENTRFRYYMPMVQYPSARSTGYLLVRFAGGDVAARQEEARATLQRVMPGAAYVTVKTLDAIVDGERRPWQLGATMFIAFGVLALLVAAVGLYGVITYSVAQRMHELGVRIALGAQSSDVVKLVVRQGIAFATAGVVIGLALALFVARWVQPLLFQQSARDPVVYGVVSAVLLLVALAASAAPAMRATRADPNTALRAD